MRLAFVDGLRGVAASAVVLCHLGTRVELNWMTIKGYLGVAIFFVLSGFVITMVLGRNTITRPFFWRFAARRQLRLDPPYWVSIALAILLAYISTAVGEPERVPTAVEISAHMFYLQDFLAMPEIAPIYWTLCLEVQFYLFATLLLWIGHQRVESAGFQVAWISLYALSLLEYANAINIAPRGLFLPHWYLFALGALVYWVSIGRVPRRVLFLALAMAGCAGPFDHGDWAIVGAITAILLHLAAVTSSMGTWLNDPVSQFLGRISYSLYLLHVLVGLPAQTLALRSGADQWTALAVGVAVSVLIAWVAYHLIERPSIHLSHLVATVPGGSKHPQRTEPVEVLANPASGAPHSASPD